MWRNPNPTIPIGQFHLTDDPQIHDLFPLRWKSRSRTIPTCQFQTTGWLKERELRLQEFFAIPNFPTCQFHKQLETEKIKRLSRRIPHPNLVNSNSTVRR